MKLRRRRHATQLEEEFDALGPAAREFHLKLRTTPVKVTVHLRRLLALVRLYGRGDVLDAIGQLKQCGWILQSHAELNIVAGLGVAVREFQLKNGFLAFCRFTFAMRWS